GILDGVEVEAISDEAINALSQRTNRQGAALSLRALATPLVNGIEGFVRDQVAKLVASDEFAQAWEQANREAHVQMVAVLTGKGTDAVVVEGNTVSLHLAIVIDSVKSRLAAQGFTLVNKLPDVNATFTLFESADLHKARTGFRLLSAMARALPIIALLLFALAVFVARRRRRTIVAGA